MNVQSPGCNQRSLRNQQQHPAGKCRSVYVNNAAGQRCAKHSGQIIGLREAHEDGRQHQQRHAREKQVVEAAAWHADGTLRGITRWCYGGSHRPFLSTLFSEAPGGLWSGEKCRPTGGWSTSENWPLTVHCIKNSGTSTRSIS